MLDTQFRTITLLLCGSWIIFALVAGYRPALWLIPALAVGWCAFLLATRPPRPPRRNNATDKQARDALPPQRPYDQHDHNNFH